MTFDPSERTFSFNSIANIELVGSEYLVSIVGELGGPDTRKQAEAVFKLTLQNPCIDPDYV